MAHAHVLQVNRSAGGIPKAPLASAHVAAGGIDGDWQQDRRYHGGPLQALCLFPLEILDALRAEGYPVGPGSLGENLTTAGLDHSQIRIGDVFGLPSGARFQITKPRGPCTTIQVYGQGIIKRLWGRAVRWGESGFYARVVRTGVVRPGDALTRVHPGPKAAPAYTTKATLNAADFAR